MQKTLYKFYFQKSLGQMVSANDKGLEVWYVKGGIYKAWLLMTYFNGSWIKIVFRMDPGKYPTQLSHLHAYP